MWKNNYDRKSDAKQVTMTGSKQLTHTREHMNKIRESLIANMASGQETESSNSKEEIEFLLKRL